MGSSNVMFLAVFSSDQLVFTCDSLLKSTLISLLFSISYVGSLYVWRTNLPRDDPSIIKRRCISAAMVSLCTSFCLFALAQHGHNGKGHSLWQYLGVRKSGFLSALCFPLVLTMILFLGPLYMLYLSGFRQRIPFVITPKEWWKNKREVATSMRNYLVGPITEEIVFRACMLPLLVPCLGNVKAIFICPLFFGVAHIHHVIESLRLGVRKPTVIWFGAVFQFFYTTVFGAVSAFIFLRTGHLSASVIMHMFCNFMGFPAFEEIRHHSKPLQRLAIYGSFVIGLVLFFLLLFPLTNPEWYANEVYSWTYV